MKLAVLLSLVCSLASAETVVDRKFVVQISEDGTETIPAQSIATPAQVYAVGDSAQAAADAAAEHADTVAHCAERVRLYSTNYVVTSTVYVQSIGGVPYDASNQLIRIQSVAVSATNVQVLATVKQLPLVAPKIDWRVALDSGAWSNITASVTQTSVPPGVTNAAAAYLFSFQRPLASSSFWRVVDNSTGASGSGLYWIVFGGITVDGHKGASCTLTNTVGGVTNRYRVVGGIVVEPTPLGGF